MNKEQHAAYMRQWRRTHKEKARIINRTYRERHKEQLAMSKRAYDSAHKEEARAYQQNWYQMHRDEVIARVREWDAAHPERSALLRRFNRQRQRQRAKGGRCELTIAEWEAIKQRQDYKCAICGQAKPLTQDHITPASRGGDYIESNIQALCHSCNARKGNRVRTIEGSTTLNATTNSR